MKKKLLFSLFGLLAVAFFAYAQVPADPTAEEFATWLNAADESYTANQANLEEAQEWQDVWTYKKSTIKDIDSDWGENGPWLAAAIEKVTDASTIAVVDTKVNNVVSALQTARKIDARTYLDGIKAWAWLSEAEIAADVSNNLGTLKEAISNVASYKAKEYYTTAEYPFDLVKANAEKAHNYIVAETFKKKCDPISSKTYEQTLALIDEYTNLTSSFVKEGNTAQATVKTNRLGTVYNQLVARREATKTDYYVAQLKAAAKALIGKSASNLVLVNGAGTYNQGEGSDYKKVKTLQEAYDEIKTNPTAVAYALDGTGKSEADCLALIAELAKMDNAVLYLKKDYVNTYVPLDAAPATANDFANLYRINGEVYVSPVSTMSEYIGYVKQVLVKADLEEVLATAEGAYKLAQRKSLAKTIANAFKADYTIVAKEVTAMTIASAEEDLADVVAAVAAYDAYVAANAAWISTLKYAAVGTYSGENLNATDQADVLTKVKSNLKASVNNLAALREEANAYICAAEIAEAYKDAYSTVLADNFDVTKDGLTNITNANNDYTNIGTVKCVFTADENPSLNWAWKDNAVDKTNATATDFGKNVNAKAKASLKTVCANLASFKTVATWLNKYNDLYETICNPNYIINDELKDRLTTATGELTEAARKKLTGAHYVTFNDVYSALAEALNDATDDVIPNNKNTTTYAVCQYVNGSWVEGAYNSLPTTSYKELALTIADQPNTFIVVKLPSKIANENLATKGLRKNIILTNSATKDVPHVAKEIELTDGKNFKIPFDIKADKVVLKKNWTNFADGNTAEFRPFYVPFDITVEQIQESVEGAEARYLNAVFESDEVDNNGNHVLKVNLRKKEGNNNVLYAYKPYIVSAEEGLHDIVLTSTTDEETKVVTPVTIKATPAEDGKVECATTNTTCELVGHSETFSVVDKRFATSKNQNDYLITKGGDFSMVTSAKTNSFGNFTQEGGRILLSIKTKAGIQYVVKSTFDEEDEATAIDGVKAESNTIEGVYTINGQKVNNMSKPGLYIVNGKKVMVK